MPTDVVCLANSRKGVDSRCFAGVEQRTLNWVRPIGNGWNGAVLVSEQQYADSSTPSVLDVVRIPLGARAPEPGQPEDYALADGAWELVSRLDSDDARELLDELSTEEPVFGNRGKAVHANEFPSLESSLAVVKPSRVTWRKRRGHLRAVFTHAEREIDLVVTDPAAESDFPYSADGDDYEWRDDADVYLVLSIAVEAHNDWHTKLVAGVVFL